MLPTTRRHILLACWIAQASALQAVLRTPSRSAAGRTPLLFCTERPPLEEIPFLCDGTLLADNIKFRGYGQHITGRTDYLAASTAWRDMLRQKLQAFEVTDVVVLPPDARSVVSARYMVSFEAPVPPQVLPGQRARVAQAQLSLTDEGLLPVSARIAVVLQLDSEGRVVSHSESLAVDPFAVGATIAHFELVYARRLAVSSGSALAIATAYWAALRELTRQELDEIVRRSRTDELAVLQGGRDDGVTDAEFERWFLRFVGGNFLAGSAIGAALYYALKGLAQIVG